MGLLEGTSWSRECVSSSISGDDVDVDVAADVLWGVADTPAAPPEALAATKRGDRGA